MEPQESHDEFDNADKKMREAEKEIEDLGLTVAEFQAIQNDFQTILKEIAGDKSLERFKHEYEKLHKTLITSHETETKLMKRCKELNSEITSHAVKVQITLKLAENDNIAMDQVKQDIERTWKLVDETKEKEEVFKEQMQKLKGEQAELAHRIEIDDVAPVEQQKQLEELIQKKDKALMSKEETVNRLKDIRNKNTELNLKRTQLEERKTKLESEVTQLHNGIQKYNEEAKTEESRKKDYEGKLEETKKKYEETQEEVKNREDEREKISQEINKLHKNIEALKNERIKLLDKKNLEEFSNKRLYEKLKFLEESEDKLRKEKEQHEEEISNMTQELQDKQDKNSKTRKEITVMRQKNKKITQDKQDLEFQKENSKNKLHELTQSNTQLRRENDSDKKKIEETMREINILNKKCTDLVTITKMKGDEIIMKRNELRKISNEVKASKKEIAKLKALIYQLKRDEDKYALEASNAYSKYVQTLEQVKYKNSMISQLQKDNVKAEDKLKKQQNLYEAVRNDRNIYSKTLLESKQEIDELRRKYKILQHQITKLREEITTKNYLVGEQVQLFNNLQEENALNDQKKKRLEEKKREKDEYIRNYENQISKLKYYISEAEQERMKQKKEYDMVINDRDILGAQLIKRNEELANLYEKIKIQQSNLGKGEVHYQEKVIECQLLRQKITELKKELMTAKQQVSCIPELKREVFSLEKDLMEAKTKVKALSEELQNPMNVHRYRKLEGTSPETYEMITKIQTLQRRLIAKTEEVAEKDFLIQEKERLYVELKNILARQPKPEVSEQLTLYQQSLKDKTKQMRSMVSELNAAHAQVNHYKFEIERLNSELSSMKENWFAQQRKQKKLQTINEENDGYS